VEAGAGAAKIVATSGGSLPPDGLLQRLDVRLGVRLDLCQQNAVDVVVQLIIVRRIRRPKCWQPVGANVLLKEPHSGSGGMS